MEEKYYNLYEVAKILKLAYMTIYRWVRKGKIPAYQVQRQYRVKHSELEKFIDSSKVKPYGNSKL